MVISFPIPVYSNLPIAPYYQPRSYFIAAISLGTTTTVTTTEDNDFVIGQLVRLLIPPTFGCRQLNGVEGYVLSQPTATQLILSIDSSQNVDAFTASSATTQPQILPVGDINTGAINSQGRTNTGTFVPGSFINISPLIG
jgi:hypothetical protein